MMIPFNKPFLTGNETTYINEAVHKFGKISGNGHFTKLCQQVFEKDLNTKKCLLTTSCTDALEMAAILADIHPGDEVIIPSYTFVSSALAFIRQGAKIIFADSCADHPNIDTNLIEGLITPRTRAIVPVHYAGMACNMDKIMHLAKINNLFVVEDAAQAIDSFYLSHAQGRNQETDDTATKRTADCLTIKHDLLPLGSIGHFGCFSFHETKNIQCGEGGMITINDQQYTRRAEIIWEKGTNRAEFFRGEIDKYGWVDTGSSFLPSEVNAAFLFAQIGNLKKIQGKRMLLWENYYRLLKPMQDKGIFNMIEVPAHATNNAHLFYLVCNTLSDRTRLIEHLKKRGIMAVFHYQSLHKSQYYKDKHDGRELPNSDRFTDCLVRLPLYFDLTLEDVHIICKAIENSF